MTDRLSIVAARLREDDGVNAYLSPAMSHLVADMLDAEAGSPEPTVHAESLGAVAARVLTSEPWLAGAAA